MNFRHRINKNDSGELLPLKIYTSVVQSLYADQAALVVGALSTAIAASILYAKTADIFHLIFAIILGLLNAKRILDSRKFQDNWEDIRKSRSLLKVWERKYLIIGSTCGAILGSWSFVTSALSTDEFALLVTISVTLANFVGISGRNFGSEKVVAYQLLWTAIPLVLGSFLFGDIYHILFGALLIPFFVGIKLMAGRLRNILLNATMTANENKLIANRFDAAMNNISHGIAMINDDRKFVVVNEKFADLAGVQGHELIDKKLKDIEGSEITLYGDSSQKRKIFVDIAGCFSDGQTRQKTYVLNDKRIIEFNYYPMKDGGVILLEDVSLRVASEAEIRILAKFDPLTHLPNRRFFMEEIKRLLIDNGELKPCSLYFIDLDKFKETNDSLGHTTGDKLLNTIAIRLKAVLVPGSLICRFGGDEFVVVVPELCDKRECGRFAARLIEEISKPLLLDGHEINVGATVGVSISPIDAKDPDLLLKYSDAALYKAKTIKRGTYAFYSTELGQSIKNKRQLEIDLRNAIDRNQFQINYQPLVNVKENKIYTCEALLRWNHPDWGWVPPDKFIPIAEDIGFIIRLGEYVLENAALQCLKWPKHMGVAVNVSSVQFQQSDMAGTIDRILKKTGLEPHRLEVEITESLMLENIETTNKTLLQLSELGVKISLDDFGTGFSSLSYLHTLPLDKVKIDRSFIEDIHTDKKSLVLLEGITKLSHSLGLKVVIEGVETIDQLELLQKRIHVDEVQGYLFGRALPAENLIMLLNGNASLYAAERSDDKKLAVG
ncbi:MAG: EAL domain-containing protein [Rhizobiaceae bacterium]|nr:EAL domain-containing protein [Rhizobiaceae bacterium]